MKFGQFIRDRRKAANLDIRSLAKKAGVDHSTVSRIEGERTEATIYTALRLCQGLDIDLPQLVQAMRDEADSVAEGDGKQAGQDQRKDRTAIDDQAKTGVNTGDEQAGLNQKQALSATDVETFLKLLARDPDKGRSCVIDWISRIISLYSSMNQTSPTQSVLLIRANGEQLPIKDHDIQQVQQRLASIPLEQLEITYPYGIHPSLIQYAYVHGGALTPVDVGAYMRAIRIGLEKPVLQLQRETGISDTVLARMEEGSVERIKLTDIMTIDSQLAENNEILSMYWNVATFTNDFFSRRAPEGGNLTTHTVEAAQQFKIAILFIYLARWLYDLSWPDLSWLTDMRHEMGG